jgi:hypothetical protein
MTTPDPIDESWVRRETSGAYLVELPPDVRRLLASLAGEMRELIMTDSELLTRLFPPPYGDDEERNAGYAVLAGAELRERRLAAFEALQDLAEASELDDEQLAVWMRSVNDIRLVLGTMLGLSDDGDEEQHRDAWDEHEAQTYQVYLLLNAFLEDIVAALAD